MSQAPLVTIGIPTYNRTRYLPEAIQSVLAQTYDDFELLIIDNASTEDVGSVVKRFSDPRLKFVRQSTNVGAVRNMNRVIKEARGKYIVIHHDDDIMLPENVEKKAAFLEANPGVGFVHSSFMRIRENGDTVDEAPNSAVNTGGVETGRDFFHRALEFNPVGCPTVMAPKAALEQVGCFDVEVAVAADLPLWLKLSLFFDVGYIAEPLLNIRLHSGQDSTVYMHGYREAEQLYSTRMRVLREFEKQFDWLSTAQQRFQRNYFCELLKKTDELSSSGNARTVIGRLAFIVSRRPWLVLHPFAIRAFACSIEKSLGRQLVRRFS